MSEQDETILQQAYREQAGCYAQALQIAEQMPSSLRERAALDDRLQQLLALFNQIADQETRLAPIKERWLQSGRTPGPELRQAMEEVTSLIANLVRHIQEAEKEAVTQRDCLGSQLDTGIRARRMQEAYGRGR
jgi:hypothetical protein